jgi:hypothetical protein
MPTQNATNKSITLLLGLLGTAIVVLTLVTVKVAIATLL